MFYQTSKTDTYMYMGIKWQEDYILKVLKTTSHFEISSH